MHASKFIFLQSVKNNHKPRIQRVDHSVQQGAAQSDHRPVGGFQEV